MVPDIHVAGKQDVVCQCVIIADNRIVADVSSRHEVVSVTQPGCAALVDAAMDRDVFPENIPGAQCDP